MKFSLFLLLLFIDPKIDYIERCKKCHVAAPELFNSNMKTKDLRKTIYEMYRRDSSEKPSKTQVDAMYKYAKSFTGKK